MNKTAPVTRKLTAIGDCAPRIGNRTDALSLIRGMKKEIDHHRPKSYYYLAACLDALQEAVEREII
ncbi:hypothetical protein AGMMS50255_6870 [Spirochaetia bacterium]|nr:hypothetical protein AGMMS50255_6870 [Spirochaetia bacterium]